MQSNEATFVDMVRSATGIETFEPYPYQTRIASDGLPELLAVPTGAGKTMAAVLPWLYRRRYHPDETVRSSTPRRLVFVLPMRVLVEQTLSVVAGWVDRLGLADDVGCHVVLGGEPRLSPWRLRPDQDMIIVGTLDMLVSRALNRGYGESRYVWPIDFGLFNADCHYVYDEVQLMGPALATSRRFDDTGAVGSGKRLRRAARHGLHCGLNRDDPDNWWISTLMRREAGRPFAAG